MWSAVKHTRYSAVDKVPSEKHWSVYLMQCLACISLGSLTLKHSNLKAKKKNAALGLSQLLTTRGKLSLVQI